MRNITVSVDTSVSALVREFLRRLVPGAGRREGLESQPLESALERRRRLFDEVFADFDARGVGLRMADNLPREALYSACSGMQSRYAGASAFPIGMRPFLPLLGRSAAMPSTPKT